MGIPNTHFRLLKPNGPVTTYRVQEFEYTKTWEPRNDRRAWSWQTVAFCTDEMDAMKVFKALSYRCENEE